MDTRIANLLKENDISVQSFDDAVYSTILAGIFETICKEIKKQNKKTEELIRFRNSRDHILVTKGIVNRYMGCKLSEQEYLYLYQLLRAFFRKKDYRIEIPVKTRTDLLTLQNYRCPFCKRTIDIRNSHLDHIVPWDFVGDELMDNYQMLCARCNERKGASSFFGLSMLFYNTSRML